MKKLYYFLGSVYFAVGLITTSALIVILGTIMESFSESHLYAAELAYSNPVFLFLLSLFFVNIFVSSIRRWPFQKKHIPFLITHLGLLMVIAGVMVKNTLGIQGQMGLLEGTASDTIIIPETFVVQVQKRGEPAVQLTLKSSGIVQFYPHSKEFVETWIKGNFAYLNGIKPFPVYPFEGTLKVSSRMKIPHDPSPYWDLYAYTADDPQEVARKVYLEGLKAIITDRKTGEQSEGEITLEWSAEPKAQVNEITIPLSGPMALLNQPYRPHSLDLATTPKLLFVKEKNGETHFFAFDAHGQVTHKTFSASEFTHYIAYDQGFSGYGVQAEVPLPMNREEKEKRILLEIGEQISNSPTLSLPLQILKDNSTNFAADFLSLLLDRPIPLDVPLSEIKACQWGAILLRSKTPLKGWPLASLMDSITDPYARITALLQQIFMIADELPDPPETCTQEELFAVLLRAYGIHPSALLQERGYSPTDKMLFECPLTVRHEPLPPLKQLEKNRPMIVFSNYQTLIYDPYGLGLSWPIGDALYKFRSETKKIPYKVRLRDARQINYPGESQAYSYESDLLITNLKDQSVVEKSVSMNEVHETVEGYRFYLSNIFPHEETRVQRIQLVVNLDPAKYWLTYPGGFIVALGILLLFWRSR